MTDYYCGCSCCSDLELIAEVIKELDSGAIVEEKYYECQTCGEEHWERVIY
mgnify:CR=1 FL=1